MPIKFLLLGGGFWVFLEGGGESANFISMGVGIFPNDPVGHAQATSGKLRTWKIAREVKVPESG